jgi:hypothetical protein
MQMHLSVSVAATKAASLKIENPSGIELQQHEHTKESKIICKTCLPSLSGREIVQRIKESDRFLIQVLLELFGKNNTISMKQKDDMLKNGIIDACLGVFKFPETIDRERDQDEPLLAGMLLILGELLVGGRSTISFLKPYRVEICQNWHPQFYYAPPRSTDC